MSRWCGLGVVAFCLWGGHAIGQDLRFEFSIEAQISGSRPWDGTASSSSALDNVGTAILGEDNFFGGIADVAIDLALDETQATISPPDPYLCIIGVFGRLPASLGSETLRANGNYSVTCTPRNQIKPNRLQFSLDLPTNIASMPIFGVALVDDDATQPDRGNDELIGFGLYIREDIREQITVARDARVLANVRLYEDELPKIVDSLFGVRRVRLPAGSGQQVEMERLSAESCNPSCRFGDASLTIKNTVGGW